jgi:hypothetical protein
MSKPSINVYVEYFSSSNKRRKDEIDNTLRQNMTANFVGQFHVFCTKEDERDCTEVVSNPFNKSIIDTSTCKIHVTDQRSTFQHVFDVSKSFSSPDTINITLNNDILLTNDFSTISIDCNDFYCISRYDNDCDTHPRGHNHGGSQDIWVWNGVSKINGANFYYGLLSCDKYIVCLAKQAGYRVSNPAYKYRGIHNHSSDHRTMSADESKRLHLPCRDFRILPT